MSILSRLTKSLTRPRTLGLPKIPKFNLSPRRSMGAGDSINLTNRYRQRTNIPKSYQKPVSKFQPSPTMRNMERNNVDKFRPSFVGKNQSQVASRMRNVYSNNPNAIGRGKLNVARDLTLDQYSQLAQGFNNVRVRNRMGTPNTYRV